jgi:hypothetical protein
VLIHNQSCALHQQQSVLSGNQWQQLGYLIQSCGSIIWGNPAALTSYLVHNRLAMWWCSSGWQFNLVAPHMLCVILWLRGEPIYGSSNSSNEFSLWLLMCFCFLLFPVRLFYQQNMGQEITWWTELHSNNLRDLKKSLSVFGGYLVSNFIPLIWRGILLPLLGSGMGLTPISRHKNPSLPVQHDLCMFYHDSICLVLYDG